MAQSGWLEDLVPVDEDAPDHYPEDLIYHDAPVRPSVMIDSGLTATQHHVCEVVRYDPALDTDEDNPVTVVWMDGTPYLNDGHHRFVGAVEGDQELWIRHCYEQG